MSYRITNEYVCGGAIEDRTAVLAQTLRTLAELSLECGEAAAYLKYSRRLARCDADSAEEVMYEAYAAAARLYNERGDQAMYRELLQRALDIRQDDAKLMLALADAIWENGDHEGARVWYRRSLAREPDQPQRIRIMERLGE